MQQQKDFFLLLNKQFEHICLIMSSSIVRNEINFSEYFITQINK